MRCSSNLCKRRHLPRQLRQRPGGRGPDVDRSQTFGEGVQPEKKSLTLARKPQLIRQVIHFPLPHCRCFCTQQAFTVRKRRRERTVPRALQNDFYVHCLTCVVVLAMSCNYRRSCYTRRSNFLPSRTCLYRKHPFLRLMRASICCLPLAGMYGHNTKWYSPPCPQLSRQLALVAASLTWHWSP